MDALGVGLQVNKSAGVGSPATTTYYTHDNAGHLVGERTPTAGNYYCLFDALGSVVAVTDKSGTVAATYRYDPYGADIGTTGNLENPWRYTGGYYDQQTKLYHYGARYYDPNLGRFNQTDPIQHQADPGQSNKYVYSSSDSVDLTDPTGRDTILGAGSACQTGAVIGGGSGLIGGAVGGSFLGGPVGGGAGAVVGLIGGSITGCAGGLLNCFSNFNIGF